MKVSNSLENFPTLATLPGISRILFYIQLGARIGVDPRCRMFAVLNQVLTQQSVQQCAPLVAHRDGNSVRRLAPPTAYGSAKSTVSKLVSCVEGISCARQRDGLRTVAGAVVNVQGRRSFPLPSA